MSTKSVVSRRCISAFFKGGIFWHKGFKPLKILDFFGVEKSVENVNNYL